MRLSIMFCLGFFALLTITARADAPEKVACSCAPATFETRLALADRVFIGTVRSVEIVESMTQPGRKDPPAIVTFDVDEAFKDATRPQETLHTSLTRVTCAGYPFEEGKIYLVYAYPRLASTYEQWSLYDFRTGTLDTGGLCGGTAEIGNDGVSEETQRLRALKASHDPKLLPRQPEL